MRPAGFAGGEICEWDRFMKRFFFCFFLCLPLLLLSGCAEKEASRECFAMDTVMQLRAYGPQAAAALDAAEQEIYRLEGLLSCQDPEAELARCNMSSETVSEETAALIQTALDLSAATGGAYDPTLYPLTLAWGFSGGQYRVPDEAELSALLAQTGAEHVQVNGCRVRLDAGTQLDLGGIAAGLHRRAHPQNFAGRGRARRDRLAGRQRRRDREKSPAAATGSSACRTRRTPARTSAPSPWPAPAS